MTNPCKPEPVARCFSPRTLKRITPFLSQAKAHATLLLLALTAFTLQARPLDITLAHSFGAGPIQENNWLRNSAGTLLSLTRCSYFLSDFQFIKSDGTAISAKDSIHYIDAFDPDTYQLALEIPDASYTTLHFKVGLRPKLNHSDPNQYPPSHPLSILENAMHWSWQAGYIFCAIEGYATKTDATQRLGFSYHLANDTFLTQVEIPIELAHSDQTQSLTLNFDLGTLLNGKNFDLLQNSSTHSRTGDPIAISLAKNLTSAFSAQLSPHSSSRPNSPGSTPKSLIGTPYPFTLPKTFPIPELPTDYPLTEERIALGETLFHSTELSHNKALSCVSCHAQENAFSDPRQFSTGFDGSVGRRQSMPLLNLAWKNSFFWDGRAASLREQVLHPIQDPTEMGADLEQVITHLQADTEIAAQFQAAFGTPQVTAERLGIALEQFLLTLTSYDSKLDSAVAGNTELTEQEKRGFELFMTEYDPRREQYGADCFHCHGSATFSDNSFHNNGLGQGEDRGLAEFTGKPSDSFKFATSSLRNVAATAPYMHDGRFNTLAEVIDHYNSGIQNSSTLDPNLAKHPAKGLELSEADKAALVAFLETLTDPRFKK